MYLGICVSALVRALVCSFLPAVPFNSSHPMYVRMYISIALCVNRQLQATCLYELMVSLLHGVALQTFRTT